MRDGHRDAAQQPRAGARPPQGEGQQQTGAGGKHGADQRELEREQERVDEGRVGEHASPDLEAGVAQRTAERQQADFQRPRERTTEEQAEQGQRRQQGEGAGAPEPANRPAGVRSAQNLLLPSLLQRRDVGGR